MSTDSAELLTPLNPLDPSLAGWRRQASGPSLPEAHATIAIPKRGFLRKLMAFAGPGYLVAVGYMDPGNWATDLEGGARFGYSLLSVILISNMMAILLQHLAAKLGVVTGRDLAQACRDAYPRWMAWPQWILCELAIAACDLAEVVGSAIALQLLFGIPLVWGCMITAVDVMLVLLLHNKGFRWIEAVVVTLIATISFCFAIEIFFAQPSLTGIALGFVPHQQILRDPRMLYVSIGILGATVMPHNLYLHSSIVQTRNYERTAEGKREAIKFSTIDSSIALTFALFINAAILILSAAAFHWNGHQDVAEIQTAYKLLGPVLGASTASILFAVALLASGQNSTLTGTLAGQIVMEGFLDIRLAPWLRRLITRTIAIVPAVVIIGYFGPDHATELLVASQVALSIQLGFAVWPLVRFTSDKRKMGEFVNSWWISGLGWLTAAIILTLNTKLLLDTLFPIGWLQWIYGPLGIPLPQ